MTDTTTTTMDGQWLRISTAAELLGLSVCTLRRWSDADRIPCYRTGGGQRRFRRADVERLLNAPPARRTRRDLHAGYGGRSLTRGSGLPQDLGRREAQDREMVLTQLLELAGTIAHRRDLYKFARTVAEQIRDLLGICECDVFVNEGDGLRFLASADRAGFHESVVDKPVTISNYPLSAAAVEDREVLVIASPEDPRLSDFERSELVDYGLASELWIPLHIGERFVGAIDIYDDKPRDYAEITGLATRVARMVAGALDTALLLDEVDRRAAALSELVALGELAAQTTDLEALLVGVAERALGATDAADCDVFIVTGEGEIRCLVSVDRSGRDESVSGELMDLDEYPLNALALQTGEIVVVPSRADPRVTALDLEAYDEFGFESEVIAPLISNGIVIGLLEVYGDRPRDFEESLDFLRHAGQIIGGAYEKAALAQRLDRSNRSLASVNEASSRLASSLDLDTILRTTAGRLCDALDVPTCSIFALSPADEFTCLASLTDGAFDDAACGSPHSLEELGVTREALETRAPTMVAGDCSAGAARAGRRRAAKRGRASSLVVPLAVGDQVTGAVVLVETRRERAFAPDELSTANSICQMAALAIHNAQLLLREQEQTERLTLLVDSGRAISSNLQLEEVLTTVSRTAAHMLRAEDCVILAYDAAHDTLTNVSTFQTHPGVYEFQGKTRPLDDYPLGRALLNGDVVEEHLSQPDLDPGSRASMEEWGELSCLTVPLRFEGSPMGLLVLTESTHERKYSPDEIDLARALGEQAAVALHNSAALRRQVEQTTRLTSLLESSRAVAATGRLEESLGIVARLTAEALGVPECLVFEFDPAEDAIIPRASYEASPSGWDGLGVPLPLAAHPVERAVLASGSALEERVSDPELDPASRASMEQWGEKTCLTVPVKFGDDYRGLLSIYERERERRFTDEEVSLARGLGQQAAAAIHSAQMLRRLEERNAGLAALLEASQATTSTLVLSEVLHVLARKTAEALRSPSCVIWDYDAEADTIVECAIFDATGEYEIDGEPQALDEQPEQALVLFADGPVVETLSAPDLHPRSRASMEKWGEKTCLSVPLIVGEERFGVMVLSETEEERHFTPAELELARGLAEQAAIAIHNARVYAGLERKNRQLADRARRERFVSESSAELASSLDRAQIFRAAAHRFTAFFDVSACDIFELVAEGELVCAASVLDGVDYPAWIGKRLGVADYGIDRLAIETRRPVAVASLDDPRLTATERRDMKEWGEKSVLVIPLVAQDRVLGTVDLLENRAERVFSADDIASAEAVCHMTSLAIDNAHQFSRLRSLTEDLGERSRRESLVNDVTFELSSTLDTASVLTTTALSLAGALDMTGCDIYLFEDGELEGGVLVCAASILNGEHCEEWIGTRLDLADWKTARMVVETHTSLAISSLDDPRLQEHERERMREWGEKSILLLPMMIGGRLIGTVELTETRDERLFSEASLATAEAIARMAALAIDNADLFARQTEHARRLTALLDAGRSITSSVVADDVLMAIARASAEALGSPECVIFEHDAAADTLTAKALYQEQPTAYKDFGKPFALSDSPADRALLEGRVITVETLSDEGIDAEVRASMEEWGEQTCVNVPLSYGEEPLGILVLIETQRERRFTAEEIELLRGLGEQAAIAMHTARQFAHLEARSLESEVLNDIARATSASLSLPDIAAAAIAQLRRLVAFEWASLLLVDGDGPLTECYATGAPSRLEGTALAALDEGFLAALQRERVVTIAAPGDLPLAADHPAVEGIRSAVIVGVFDGEEPLGALALGNYQESGFSGSQRRVFEGLSAHLSLAVKNALLFENVKQLHLGNLKALSSALLAKDNYTIGHTARVAAYAGLLATELGWSDAAVEEIEEAAYLHDIGKIAVSDRILLKPGALNDEEWQLMRQHPVVSAEIIEPLMDARLVGGVRNHHERYDGRGYPDGLAGDEIPEMARLLAVVDAYDAMSSRRIYKAPLSDAECLAELDRCRGAQFDPRMVDAFVGVLHHMKAQKRVAIACATETAARIDPKKHGRLLQPADAARPEYDEIVAILRAATASHPPVYCLNTEMLADHQHVMVVVDSDEDPATRIPVGQLMVADEEEIAAFRDRPTETNVVFVDAWGAYVSGLAPIRDETGAVVGIVSANIPAGGSHGLALQRSDLTETFTSLTTLTTEKLTRADVDAITDPLTGLYNHRHLHQRLAQECSAAARGGPELSLLFCDVDQFKSLNDCFGHAVGDNVLKGVAQILSGCLRRIDLAARYGGDEFAVLLIGAGEEDATEVAERVRASVESADLHPGAGKVTLSIGIATLSADAPMKEDLLDRADRAMYRAKSSGRNRWALYSPDETSQDSVDVIQAAGLHYLSAMAELADAKGLYERRHSETVKHLATGLATELGLSQVAADQIGEAAKLRDIGLLTVPDDILGKPGELTESEWKMIRQHSSAGRRLLREVGAAEAIAEAIAYHHERYDGTGYPEGLRAEEIPLPARIVAAASAYRAMVVPRPYRDALSDESALEEMSRCAGSQFDPAVVAGLRRVLGLGQLSAGGCSVLDCSAR